MCLVSGSGSKERDNVATAKCEDKVLNDELGEVATYLYHIMKGFQAPIDLLTQWVKR